MSSGRVNGSHFLPIVVKAACFVLGLALVINQEWRSAVCVRVEHRTDKHCVRVKHEKALPRVQEERFQFDEAPAIFTGLDRSNLNAPQPVEFMDKCSTDASPDQQTYGNIWIEEPYTGHANPREARVI